MKPQVTIARVWYVGGAVAFALVAIALTRARGDLRDATFLCQVLIPTVLVACCTSLLLISSGRIASTRAWVLAGVLVPVCSLIGFFAPIAITSPVGVQGLGLPILLMASIVIVPVGVAGHLLIRSIVVKRFFA